MKNFLTLIFSILTITLYSQQAQKGLLWKITGNGITQPSYIYGNMHVSEKIAFHLGEEFFDAISNVDKIALESNPIIWLQEIMHSKLAANYIGRFDIERQAYRGFYKNSFKLSIPDNDDLAKAIMRDHYFMNWLLYRENKSNSDFEEETFLDMFIYQAGAKNGKEVLSLEDFRQTTHYAEMASIPDIEDKKHSKWYKNMTKERSYTQILEEAYRQQDLSLIDSLQKETNGKNEMYWMIYKRNEIMAHNIDSIIQSGTSLFSGVGAAHLPGEKGILKLLEKMGYTLTPMKVTFTDKARQFREEFDKKKLPPKDNEYKTYEWELFKVESPVKIYETPYSTAQRHFFGPELTNGSHYTIKQISTYTSLKGLSREQYYQKVDSLLFENIPGKIESKKEITSGSFYKGFDILNKTKNGDYQRFRIYISPINMFIFKMGGKDDYVKDYGDRFFNGISLKTPGKNWKTITPIHNDFSVDVPDYYSINFNKKVTSLYGQPVVEAYDINDSSYYFLRRKSLYDWNFIEEDGFELKRIAEQFFIKQHLDTVKAHIINDAPYPTAVAYGYNSDSSAYVAVKVIINGPYFYLMYAVTKDKKENNRFFDSFKINDFKYNFSFENKTDSANFFSVNSNYLSPREIDYTRNKAYRKKRNKNNTKDTKFKQKTNSNNYYTETYERIYVKTKKFHIYKHYDNIDSLWKDEIKSITIGKPSGYGSYFRSNYSYSTSNPKAKPSLIVKSKKKAKENGLDVLYLTITDTASSRAYLVKYVLKQGMLYRMQASTDTSGHMSVFVKNFFDSFTPMDTILGRSLFEDKASLFFNSIYGTDSLAKERAMQSVTKIDFKKKDIDSLILTINNYKFPAKYIEVKKTLIDELIGIKDYDPIEYVTKLYKESGDTAMYQIEILNSLGWKGDKKSVKTYLSLLDYDIPISGDSWSSNYIFSPFAYGVKKHKEKTMVFPELLNYTFIGKYRSAIIKTLAKQVDSNYINPSVYKKNINQLLREAKIVMKEQISYEQNEQADDGNGYRWGSSNKYKYKSNSLLVNYAIILIPHNKNKKVNEFLAKFYKLQNFTIRNQVFCRMQKHGIEIDTAVWGELARDPVNVSNLYKEMQDNKILDKFPMQYINQQIMAQSLLFQSGINFEEDSIMFIEKRFVNDGKDSGYVYFFKTKEKGDDDWELNYSGYQPKDTTKVSLNTDVDETGEYIDKALDIKEIIDEKVNIIRLQHHPHADGKEDHGGFRYFF